MKIKGRLFNYGENVADAVFEKLSIIDGGEISARVSLDRVEYDEIDGVKTITKGKLRNISLVYVPAAAAIHPIEIEKTKEN